MEIQPWTRLTEVRKQEKLSQKDLAAKLGIQASSVSNWENGARKPTLDNVISIARALNVTVDYLLDVGTDEMYIITKKEYDALMEAYDALDSIKRRHETYVPKNVVSFNGTVENNTINQKQCSAKEHFFTPKKEGKIMPNLTKKFSHRNIIEI